jgi:hypothetical protein
MVAHARSACDIRALDRSRHSLSGLSGHESQVMEAARISYNEVGVPLVFPNSSLQAVAAGRKVPGLQTASVSGRLDGTLPLRLWHLASLDAPTVAAVWALAFAWTARVHLPISLVASIALVVWSVYIADRLLDARRALRRGAVHGLRERHFFHWRHRRILIPLGIASALAAACLVVPLMSAVARQRGAVLAAAAAIYFVGVHACRGAARKAARMLPRLASKETLVGVLFTVGCALPAWNRAPSHPWALILPAAYLAALAWLNCAAITRWENASSFGSEPGSATGADFNPEGRFWVANVASASWVFACACGLALAGVVSAILLALENPQSAMLLGAGAASALLLAVLDRLRGRLTPLCLRAAADLVLLTPLVLLLR